MRPQCDGEDIIPKLGATASRPGIQVMLEGFSVRRVCVYQSHVSKFHGYNTRHLRCQLEYTHAALSHS